MKRSTPLKQSKILPRRNVEPMCKVRKGPPRRTAAARSKAWLDLVRAIPCCVLCGTFGTEAAHRNEGKGVGMKVDDCASASLCKCCHFEIDNGSELVKHERRARLDRAIVLTLIQLVRSGKVGCL
jgi:hypothetical protein